jgi:hypothetical protein
MVQQNYSNLSTADLQAKFDAESEHFLEKLAVMENPISMEAINVLSRELRLMFEELQRRKG